MCLPVSSWVERLTRCRGDRLGSRTQLAAGTVRAGVVDTCTLLGPEGPGADRASRKAGGGWWLFLWGLLWCHGCGMRRGYRPYFENYTVDASIFDMIPLGMVS